MLIRVTHVGTATLILEIGGLRLLTDPVFGPAGVTHRLRTALLGIELEYTSLRGPALAAEDVGPVDAVLLSHDHHGDNFDDAGRELARRARQVLTTESGARRLTRDGFTSVRGLAPGATVELPTPAGPALTVTATPARHGPPASRFAVGDVTGFLLESPAFERGALWISGDTVWFRGTADLARRTLIGTAFLHLGAPGFGLSGPVRYTFSAAQAVRASRALGAATIVPIHTEGWSHFRENSGDVQRRFERAGRAERLRWLGPGVAEELVV